MYRYFRTMVSVTAVGTFGVGRHRRARARPASAGCASAPRGLLPRACPGFGTRKQRASTGAWACVCAALRRAAPLALALLAWPASAGPTVRDLVEVADITSLSVSPSGRTVAFRVEKASLDSDGYRLDWYVADLDSGSVRRVGDGGAAIEGELEPLAIEPAVWSPDERFVFHRALVDGAIGLWRTAVDGSGSGAVLVADADVEQVAAGGDGASLTYALGPSRTAIERAERREYDDGILVDGSVDLEQNLYRGGLVAGRLASQRLVGRWYTRAGLLWDAPRTRYRLDLDTLASRPLDTGKPPPAAPFERAKGVMLTLVEQGRPPVRVRREHGMTAIEVERHGAVVRCAAALCRSATVAAVAWRPGSDDLVITTEDRHFRQTLHLWDTVGGSLRTLVSSDGLLSGSRIETRPCAIAREVAVCVAASATSPPRLVAIDLVSSAQRTVFDPNALMRTQQTARIEQASWSLPGGLEATGTVLLPPGGAGRAPLFVTYYHCPGFLRGGLGDEFPLAPLADAGFVVACLNTVPTPAGDIVDDYGAALASVEGLVDLLAGRGLIDPARVGMGGFSFGSEATMWVAANSQLLAAAALASPQGTPSSYWSHARPDRDYARVLRTFFGLGRPDETPDRWRVISPALHTERIGIPILMQMPENEARTEAEFFTRLRQEEKPVELFAFPDESHVKWQPRHRRAVYRRNLDWFRYWLQDYVDPDPGKAAQYRRWDALKANWRKAVAGEAVGDCAAPEQVC